MWHLVLTFTTFCVFSLFVVNDRFSTMHIFRASFFAAAIQSLPGGDFCRRHQLTALLSLHLNHLSAGFPKNTLQYQQHQPLRLQQTATLHPFGLQVILQPLTFSIITTPYLQKPSCKHSLPSLSTLLQVFTDSGLVPQMFFIPYSSLFSPYTP